MDSKYTNRTLCINQNCTQRSHCLRAIGYTTVTDQDTEFPIINPALATGDNTCAHYVEEKFTKVAYGFMHLCDEMPRNVYTHFSISLRCAFGKNPYYALRNGERPITPEQQQQIIDTLNEIGYKCDVTFDRYEEQAEW